jgi:hypothetical protein
MCLLLRTVSVLPAAIHPEPGCIHVTSGVTVPNLRWRHDSTGAPIAFPFQCSVSQLLPFDIVPARAPFVLQSFVEALPVHVLAPPLTPARQEYLLRVLGEVVLRQGTENVGCTCYSRLVQVLRSSLRGDGLTLRNWLGIRHIRRDHRTRTPPEACTWNKTG